MLVVCFVVYVSCFVSYVVYSDVQGYMWLSLALTHGLHNLDHFHLNLYSTRACVHSWCQIVQYCENPVLIKIIYKWNMAKLLLPNYKVLISQTVVTIKEMISELVLLLVGLHVSVKMKSCLPNVWLPALDPPLDAVCKVFAVLSLVFSRICSYTLCTGGHYEPAPSLTKKYYCTSWYMYESVRDRREYFCKYIAKKWKKFKHNVHNITFLTNGIDKWIS